MAINQKFSILEPLAKELGYKDAKEMRDALGKEEAGRPGIKGAGFGNIGGAGGVGTGFLGGREIGSGLGVGVKSRLAKGASIKESITGGFKDFTQSFSKENIKRRTLEKTFGGPGLVSAFARGKLKQKYGTSPAKTDAVGADKSADSLGASDASLKIISKESLVLPNIARDVNVMRQNLQKLVKLWGGEAATKKEAEEKDKPKTTDKDSSTSPTPIKQEGEVERAKDISFFAEQDKKEAELEAGRQKDKTVVAAAPTPDKKEGDGFLDSIMSLFANGFMQGIKKIFSPKILGQVLKKVFLPIAIVGTLFSGITAGFKKYQETGNFSEAILSGLGGMLKFLTFGLFGEDTLKSMWEAVSKFLDPITKTISGIFTDIKNFFKKIFGMGGEEDKGKDKIPKVTPQQPDPSKFVQDAAKASSISGVSDVSNGKAIDPSKFVQDAAKASGASDEKASDISGLFGAVQSGDTQGLFTKAQELAQKYPEPPASETSPVPMSSEGVPLDQAQRNFELNTALTGRASAALGVPLEAPTPPTPAAGPSPMSEPPPPTPSPAPALSKEEKIKQLEENIENNKKRFARREENAKRHIESFSKRYADQPERVQELKDDYDATLKTEKAEMEERNKGLQKEVDVLKSSPDSGSASSPSSVSPGGTTAPGSEAPSSAPSAPSGGGGTVSAMAGGESAPAPITAEPPTSGASLSTASSEIAEAQRMESAADTGSVVNAPVTNNSRGTTGQQPKNQTASVFNEELANLLGGIRI